MTRARRLLAWLGRRFRRRRPALPTAVPGAPPRRFSVGTLRVTVTRQASASVLGRPARLVYRVEVVEAEGLRRWAGRLGFPLGEGSERRAAEEALADLERLWRTPEEWQASWTAGLSARQAEALLGAVAFQADAAAAAWIGPALAAARRGGEELVEIE